jgi:hypothetical protein
MTTAILVETVAELPGCRIASSATRQSDNLTSRQPGNLATRQPVNPVTSFHNEARR